jgi:FAD/FMN-containing dehydrogenase/Fe-S oxidoreductase
MSLSAALTVPADLANTLRHAVAGDVRFDTTSRVLYSTDASNYQIEPLGVVIPRTADDIAAAVAICAQAGAPILARGAGSSLSGQAIGRAIILDCSTYLDKIEAIHAEERWVRVQPGVIINRLNRALRPFDLMLGPDPASAERATVGGSLANNATGAHSILYGMFADQVLGADVVLADGSCAHFDTLSPTDPAWAGRAAGDSHAAAIYAGVGRLLQTYGRDIQDHFPAHWRRSSGYGLTYLLPDAPGRHPTYATRPQGLAPLLAGSEGTLAVLTSVTLAVVPRPKRTALAICQFDDLLAAMEATNVILTCQPSAVELMDAMLIDLARQQPGTAGKMFFVDGTPAALLAVEFTGASEAELNAHLDRLGFLLHQAGWPRPPLRLLDATAQATVWDVRKVGLGILMSLRGDVKPIPCIEDVSVPVANLPRYVADVLDLLKRHNTRGGFYAHASAGCLHIRPLVNLKTGPGVEMMVDLAEGACELALRHGGVMTGEHGDGLAHSYVNAHLFGPRLYAAMCDLKAIFDPGRVLNPGKKVHGPDPRADLRYGPTYRTLELRTYFDFGAEGGFAGAVEMCNGAGVCRKLDAGTMCPSFQATREEQDSTRGRANALRAALSGRPSALALTGRELHAVMDLCLGCKACKTECPSSVDMARIKTEYLAHVQDAHGVPLRSRIFGHIARLNALAAPIAPLANLVLQTPLARRALAALGVHPARALPSLAPQTFSSWFMQRTAPLRPGANGPVLLFHDTWVEYNHPAVGQAAVRLLEAAGYQVLIAPQRRCCGRPLLSKGLLAAARRLAHHNVEVLAPYVAQGMPVLGLEPSCVLSFRDEYLGLLLGNQQAQALAARSFTIEEFLDQECRAGRAHLQFKPGSEQLLLHGHCHQKALVGAGAALALLRMLPGRQVSEIEAGCCGMAGSFGYETEHYAISQKIAEDRLLPAIQAAPLAQIVADGVSCREQIAHFGGRPARHVVEVLADALD